MSQGKTWMKGKFDPLLHLFISQSAFSFGMVLDCVQAYTLDEKCGCLDMFVQDTDMQFLCWTSMH